MKNRVFKPGWVVAIARDTQRVLRLGCAFVCEMQVLCECAMWMGEKETSKRQEPPDVFPDSKLFLAFYSSSLACLLDLLFSYLLLLSPLTGIFFLKSNESGYLKVLVEIKDLVMGLKKGGKDE